MLLATLMLLAPAIQKGPQCVPASQRPKASTVDAPAAGAASARRARPLTHWTTNENYPLSSLLSREQGTVEFTLAIDAGGCPVGCRITRSSGYKTLDQAACGVMYRKARFDPATDENGNPVPGTYHNRFTWSLR
jgi:protein TonB